MRCQSFVAPLLAAASAVVAANAAILKGHDLSSAAYMEANDGARWFTANGVETPLENILAAGGMESVRLRYVR
jgi:arabinogalactan endo-1,4-beta-galactosidase